MPVVPRLQHLTLGSCQSTRFHSRVHLEVKSLSFLAIGGILVDRSEISFLCHANSHFP